MAEPDELRREYAREDLGEGERGKYLERYRQSTNIVMLEPDVAKAFPTPKAVNEALREILSRRTGS